MTGLTDTENSGKQIGVQQHSTILEIIQMIMHHTTTGDCADTSSGKLS